MVVFGNNFSTDCSVFRFISRSISAKASAYLTVVAEENDPRLLVEALAKVAKAHGISQIARKASVTRVGLYKTLSRRGNPELRTFLKLLAASGLQLSFKPKPTALAA